MAEQIQTPLDIESKLPLPIAPKCQQMDKSRVDLFDEHHGWHPRNAPQLRTLAGIALRNSWIQLVEKDLHNEGPFRYHRFFSGPELPSSDVEVFGSCILACAGYVPDTVIDTVNVPEPPFTRRATQTEIDFLRQANSSDPFAYEHIRYGYDPIREFFQDFALSQDISGVESSTLDEFLNTQDRTKKTRIAQHLLWITAELATDGIKEKYTNLANQARIHPAMPRDPKPLFKWKLGSGQRVATHVLPKLEEMVSLNYS